MSFEGPGKFVGWEFLNMEERIFGKKKKTRNKYGASVYQTHDTKGLVIINKQNYEQIITA